MPGLTREQIEMRRRARPGRRRAGDAAAPRGRALARGVGRRSSASLGALDDLAPLLVCGMGGSAIGGDLAAAVLGDRLTARRCRRSAATSCRRGRSPSSVVLCASYSGNTEETLACYDAAGALGAIRVAVTTGGTPGRGGARRTACR